MADPMNKTRDITSECQVVVFNWKYDTRDADLANLNLNQLSEATAHDISNYIKEVSFGKQLNSPSGQFQIMLENDRDWKQYVRKGSWCLIYMSQDGGLRIPKSTGPVKGNINGNRIGDIISPADLVGQRKKLRCIGYIDTVRCQGIVGEEKGEYDTNFVVSGRDFGVVYEETEIWHNRVNFDESLLKTTTAQLNANSIKTVDLLLETLHKLFFSPEDIIKGDLKDNSLTSIALQWLLPQPLFVALGITSTGNTSYYGKIPNLLNFSPSKASYPVESPITSLNGIAWERLKQFSIEPFHELFCEINDDGFPRLNFRPIPWKITQGDKFKDLSPTITSFRDLPTVELFANDIVDFDIGEDNHTRYNLFWSTLKTSLVSIETSLTLSGDTSSVTGFPRVNQNSVRRHGLRMLYSEINANIVLGKEEANKDLIRQYNELALEYWEDSHFLESGTITIIGNNEIKLGKRIHLNPGIPYNEDKYFYIEGYEETFNIDEEGKSSWTQSVMVTRGTEKRPLEEGIKSGDRLIPYRHSGDYTGQKE